ncbi:MAG: PilZ domain-containing protein [Leptospira sp.]|nr:PilZ domain-containing protein [Leptospira sp.]
MKVDRRGIRITPKEFEEYKIRIDLGELTFEGNLGNVSDSGLCVIMNDDSLMDEVDSEITGAILSRKKHDYLDFQGKIVWAKESSSEPRQYLAGVEFEETLVLTNELLLKSMLFESS